MLAFALRLSTLAIRCVPIVAAILIVCAPQARALNCDPTYVADFQTCLSPPDVGAAATTPTSIKLGWAIYSGTYTLPDGVGIWRGTKLVYQSTNPNSPNTFTDTGLASKTTYTYTICMYWTAYSDENGGSHPADPASHPNNSDPAWECVIRAYVTAAAPPPPPPPVSGQPSSPLNIRIGKTTWHSLEVIWTSGPRTDLYQDQILWGPAKLNTTTNSTPLMPHAPNAGNSVTLDGLSPATSYTISVVQFTKDHKVGNWGSIQARTDAPPPAPMPGPIKPSGVSAYRASPSVVVVQWSSDYNDYHQVERRLITDDVVKNTVNLGPWMKVGSQILKPKTGYSDIANAPSNPDAHLEYRVCGGFLAGYVCSDPVGVGPPPPPTTTIVKPH